MENDKNSKLNTISEHVKVGTFMINPDLVIESISISHDLYADKLRSSIINALTWLNNNILHTENGNKIKNKISNGITFTDETNQYLISTCLYWKNNIEKQLKKNYDRVKQNKNIDGLTIDTSMNTQEYDNNDSVEDQYWLEYLMMLKSQNIKINKSQGYFVCTGVDQYEIFYPVIHGDHADYLPENIISQYLLNNNNVSTD